jgi:mono/diheme cytochrome c family protein
MAAKVFAVLAVLVASGALVAAQQKPKIEKVPIQQTSPVNGREMFVNYCASCHGLTGKGDGPAAKALTKAPADLTKINARNGGTFPQQRVSRFIQGADEVPAHGNRDMPVWGQLFKTLNPTNEAQALVRVNILTDYVKSIQQ